ncbi:MAG: hypothetical protein ACRYFX_13525 [Janthinobacterium lividum]
MRAPHFILATLVALATSIALRAAAWHHRYWQYGPAGYYNSRFEPGAPSDAGSFGPGPFGGGPRRWGGGPGSWGHGPEAPVAPPVPSAAPAVAPIAPVTPVQPGPADTVR